ncbi:RluA family pseudouridine synthase [Lacrimispora sp. 38-1]|uniref:RluA family pseudouridine synthase n=1 Tax=Lacrimispora sp. 38-1 TaxID=3125778 RepID=UPI003CE678E6
MKLNILFEDDEILVVEKPAGIESQSGKTFEPDMVSEIKKHINTLSTKKGEPYVGVIHRLDKPVGGIMVYAKSQIAAEALSRQVSEHQMEKIYYAVVCGKPVDNFGAYVDYLWKDGKNNSSKIVEKGIKSAKPAELDYWIVDCINLEGRELSLLKIRLKTGRHHQIRVQMAGHGTPLWGDRKYNPEFQDSKAKGNVALFASGLTFTHPLSRKKMTFSIKPNEGMFQYFSWQAAF